MHASVLILAIIVTALLYRAHKARIKTARDKPVNPDKAPAVQHPPADEVPLANIRTPHPIYRAVTLAERVKTVQELANRLPQSDETLAERRIITEQIRMARFESELIKTVICGHHPAPDAINIEWCYSSAELSLGFARARIERLSASVQ
ncbi:MAG: hypothetical protein IPP57_13775 [Candidatus Obscuribacter sp.]|nr:hypothetical protein [Candidatus Obscuribacter sp.]MBK9201087.1 hypothetical protein [Candidatus Obscuribacter sp.]MBK9621752.1 hypothetical protein [Candidatus Obscuribacter sp.]MBK9771863.1 hypothetical protein [Candidatus Obscuribacter sp.]MBL0185900.1 hypothetical protein [Candidatus Obscuribacter sp.]